MKLITFATIEEAEATLASFNAKTLQPSLFSSDIGLIAITGIGPFAAYVTLKALDSQFDTIINIGFAGSLRKELECGAIYPIATCKKHLWHPKGASASKQCLAASFGELVLNPEGLRLSTVDFPLYKNASKLLLESDLVDMEGYGIALGAQALGKQCNLYKLVSDYCTDTSASLIKNNMSLYSQTISSYLKTLFI